MKRPVCAWTAAGAVALFAGALAGCGAASADLFLVRRSGSVPGAQLELLVRDDGTARCNRGRQRALTDPELLVARQLQRDLDKPATRGAQFPAGPRSVFTYAVQTSAGRLRFSDTSAGIPASLRQVAAFTHQVAKGVCGLAR